MKNGGSMALERGPRHVAMTREALDLFRPKLVTTLQEECALHDLRSGSDVLAGQTAAIVALPLSMAVATTSEATLAQGLNTAIVVGIFVSLLGGARFKIGGPAGSAIVIFASQMKELLELTLAGVKTGPLIGKRPVLWQALPTVALSAALLSLATLAGIVVCKTCGAFFLGAAASIRAILDRIGYRRRMLVIDITNVPFLASTAAKTPKRMAEKASRHGIIVISSDTTQDMREDLLANGKGRPLVSFAALIESSMRKARRMPGAQGSL